MLCAKAKTRQLLCDCSGALRTPSSQVCRAGGIEPYESVCQRHFDKIRREDDRTCSCPSSWGHSRKIHAHPVPTRYYQILDQVGRSSASSYNPGQGHAGATSAVKKLLKGSKPSLDSKKRSARYVLKILYLKNAGENVLIFTFLGCF